MPAIVIPLRRLRDDQVLGGQATLPPTMLPDDEMLTPSSWLGDHPIRPLRLLNPMRLPSTTLRVPLVYGVLGAAAETMLGIAPST